MFKCYHCGHEFDEPTNECNMPVDPNDERAGCPNCGSPDFELVGTCIECGAAKVDENLFNGMCIDCIRHAAYDVRKTMDYGNDRKEAVELNGVLAFALSTVQIEAILTNWLMTNGDIEAEGFKFATDDIYDFSDWLVEHREDG